MDLQYTPYAVPLFIAASISLSLLIFAGRRLEAPGASAFRYLMLSATMWSLPDALLLMSTYEFGQTLWGKVEYFGIASAPLAWLAVALQYTGRHKWLERRRLCLLAVVPFITLLLVWTNEVHKLIYQDYTYHREGDLLLSDIKYGVWFWVNMAYSYVLMLLGTILYVKKIIGSFHLYRGQVAALLFGGFTPWVGNVIYIFKLSPVPGLDITPFSFTLGGLMLAWGLFRYRLFELVPVARDTVFENMDDSVIVLDAQNRLVDLNPAAEGIFGISATQVIAKPAWQVLSPWIDLGARYLNETEAADEITLNQNGKQRHYDLRASALTNRQGHLTGRLIVLRDITIRNMAEDALMQSEMRFRDISHSMADWIWEVDKRGRYTYASGRVKQILGYDTEEIIGKTPFELMPKEEAEHVGEVLRKIASEKKPIVDLESWHLTKVGKKLCLLTNGVPILGESGELIGYRGVDKDITERKRAEGEKRKLEAQLQRAQKMEAIGTLAGGVAHDLNNILSGIVSYPELLLMDLPEDSPLKNPILTIQKSGEKAAAIVQDLLTLARRGVVVAEVMNLNNIISEYLKSPEYEKLKFYHPNVQVETDLDRELLNISGSPVHLSKTIMNLVSNAAEAMPHGGRIFTSVKNQYIDKPIRGYDDVAEGDYVVFSISDTGVGISPEDMERIFEPFYTKKVMGRSGTGLGMAVVWGTVKDHKGYIDVQSTEGKGTTFTLYFPVTREEAVRDKSSISIEDYMGKGESILIVDDMKEQREIASGMLKKLGYTVAAVSSGEEAVYYLKEHTVDLILLDMIMDPGIDGLETYKRIVELHPKQKAIIASGFSETDRLKEAQRLGAGAYVKKPYVLEKIGIAVRNELD